MLHDFERCYRALESRDARFDGWFFVGVTSTGVYCRPSCPAVTPRRENVRLFATAAAAQGAGFRACLRCRPDLAPGAPGSGGAGDDVAARALRLIADGVVDREGVSGLAARLGYSERQLHRRLTAALGAGPQALARAQRAQTARLLLDATALPVTEIAFAAGFSSVRQFNDTIRSLFGRSPSQLRRRGAVAAPSPGQPLALRLAFRPPLAAARLLEFLVRRAVPGVEEGDERTYRRTLRLPRAPGAVEVEPADGAVRCTLRLGDLRDLSAAVERCRRLLDLDADPLAVDGVLARDPALAPHVAAAPGLRVPGHVGGFELAVRAVLGQQVSVPGARTLAARLVARAGTPLAEPLGTLTHVFPDAEALLADDASRWSVPEARGRALRELARAVAAGDVALDAGADREAAVAALQRLPGIGPWTAGYVAMRALGEPDVLLASDLGVRHGLRALGLPEAPREAQRWAERWRPWRSYATQHLWALAAGAPAPRRAAA